MKDRILSFIAKHTEIIPLIIVLFIVLIGILYIDTILKADIPDWLKYVLLG